MPEGPKIYRIVVVLKDWETVATEPMTEEVGRMELSDLRDQIRILRNPTRTIAVGPNLIVRQRDIRHVKLVTIDEGDDEIDGLGLAGRKGSRRWP